MIENRKEEHIKIAENENVVSEHNFWDDIRIVHRAIPEVDFNDIDTGVKFLGKQFNYPILISSMTGGTETAKIINKNLAMTAEHFKIGMGVGSMRVAVKNKNTADTFSVINDYKIPAKFANIGAPQLVRQDSDSLSDNDIEYIYNLINADFLIVHFNFLQEMVQPEGDRNSKGVIKRLKDIAGSYNVIAKETGSGFSKEDALSLLDAGVKAIDVGGLGGTSFAAIEYYRAQKANDEIKMHTGKAFWNWGIPSPASIKYCSLGEPVIGSGGLRNGLDLAKAIMFGATLGGFARELLKDANTSFDDVKRQMEMIINDLKITMMLTSSRNIDELKHARYITLEPLRSWLEVYK
ncbi:type 2 isopentenyl-diphosphate Delta-isomerase [Picrophilus oshimae]|uniref:Isopentenyl-diphosphate delta-isomerase n=1 Tax=Picrophilus torridus (strain ATCC 700027 / DSM 9790 / JCM 10055 / NBRC 100828 / KAW 2/3) TaxID=1122961 RepID=IDI2_PICTO|nr:type 2 isopentenyl-diphosphate Delta-isomerase [Picrophilus oshimae]Q6L1S1.1 RecName: Full=Isopentenyl-diphosphate delta-isomerase; Short=IPP isomerase; AltName: Full=Isopentenyl diphosphate:dimethylallyl diphosphate isomerase; AltName: Full=Isopentenyl pyrophosphate isomerase; AltName: Full=Type 2 isopentenyl diphosphate isomerase; Short=IDI-2 [Picrophilus oshimae DSM 9789]AAT43081.1 hypothetical isopentenyl-diphosphate delta-isomerase [Picrophilus oshimae DSM 9789]